MNNLSWFLYIADVLYQQTVFWGVLCFLAPLAYVIFRFAAKIAADGVSRSDGKAMNEWAEKERDSHLFTTYKFFIYPLIGLFLLSLVPNKDTFYLIAASEAGEMVVNTPEAQEIMSSLQEILNVQLNKLKEAE